MVDRYYTLLEEGKVYYVTKASIKPARKQFSAVQNDYELSLDQNTEISPVRSWKSNSDDQLSSW